MSESGRPRGVFAGLATLDVVHRVASVPAANEKVTASAQFLAAGGPAANAAVAFAALGGHATLLTVLGGSAVARWIADDLRSGGVEVVDIAPTSDVPPPVSSVIVTEASGDRAVVGGDAKGVVVPRPADALVDGHIHRADVVIVDGHHPAVAMAVAERAVAAGVAVVVDAGRWRPVMEGLMPLAADVVASADFRVPGAADADATARAIRASGVPLVVRTGGADPVHWYDADGEGVVPVPVVDVRDTLGAGDVFHGAYAFARVRTPDIRTRIEFATRAARARCAVVGPSAWREALATMDCGHGDD